MIVDDCPTTRKILSIYLRSKGFEVTTADNGLDAIEKLATHAVNMILTDLNMPYMDGIELTRTIRSDPNWSSLPILMVTTEADPEERARALEAGANGYIVKPVTADSVTHSIKSILHDFFAREGKENA